MNEPGTSTVACYLKTSLTWTSLRVSMPGPGVFEVQSSSQRGHNDYDPKKQYRFRQMTIKSIVSGTEICLLDRHRILSGDYKLSYGIPIVEFSWYGGSFWHYS